MAYIRGTTSLPPITKDLLTNETFIQKVFADTYRKTIFANLTSDSNDGIIVRQKIKPSTNSGSVINFARKLNLTMDGVDFNGPDARTYAKEIMSSVCRIEASGKRHVIQSRELFLQAVESQIPPEKFEPLQTLEKIAKEKVDEKIVKGMTSDLYPITAYNNAAGNGLMPRAARCFTCKRKNAEAAYTISGVDTFTYAHDHPLSYQLGEAAYTSNPGDRLAKMSVAFIRKLVVKARVNKQKASPLEPVTLTYNNGVEQDKYILLMGYTAAEQLKQDSDYTNVHYMTLKNESGIASALNRANYLGMVEDVECSCVPLISQLLPSFDIRGGTAATGKAAWSLLLGKGAAGLAIADFRLSEDYDSINDKIFHGIDVFAGAGALRFEKDPTITEAIDSASPNKKFEQGIIHVFTEGE